MTPMRPYGTSGAGRPDPDLWRSPTISEVRVAAIELPDILPAREGFNGRSGARMGWRLFRRFKVLPGVTVNLSRSGPSLSLGPRGIKRTISKRGLRTTVGLPGTGIFYSDFQSWKKRLGNRPGGAPAVAPPLPPSTGVPVDICSACGLSTGRSWLNCPHCGHRLPQA